jgi:sugar/nucleoside kinase (ribokinase family)
VGITPQGLVREWDAEGEISLAPLERSQLPAQVDGAVLSERELPHCKWLTEQTLIAVTAGSSPTSIRLPGGEAMTVPVPDAPNPRDDLGAGDVFAAAFFVALRERRAPAAAAAYGNAAATVRIAGIGASAVGDRLAIEAALGADGSPSVR